MGISDQSAKQNGLDCGTSRPTRVKGGTSPAYGSSPKRLDRVSAGLALLLITGYPGLAQSGDAAAQIYRKAAPSVFVVSVRNAAGTPVSFGTGFLVGKNTLVTNLHVVEGGDVFLEQGAVRIPASVERRDAINDLAMLTVGAEISATPLTMSQRKVAPGDSVFAIGNPEGLEKSISTGVVSAVRDFDGRKLIQISAPISHGSSGGPVLDSFGDVIGVTVAMLKDGQNLNFAVPAKNVEELIAGKLSTPTNLSALFQKIDALHAALDQEKYSVDQDSSWQKTFHHMDLIFKSALETAGANPDLLMKVAEEATDKDVDVGVVAAERATTLRPSARASFILGDGLRVQAMFAEASEKSRLLERAERAFRTAIRLAKTPDAEMYYDLADVLEDRGSAQEAESNFLHALRASAGADGTAQIQTNSIRGLARTTFALKRPEESQSWFEKLASLGAANAIDWEVQADRLSKLATAKAGGDIYEKAAGESYEKAASLGNNWRNWCRAAIWLNGLDVPDSVLSDARKCIEQGTGKKDSEMALADAHGEIADVLNDRGVYSEALSHAREASDLNSSNPWFFQSQANALFHLRRFQEAVNASNQAIRLSDGKFAAMHFRLGSSYFELQNWEFAKQSFQKAAELDPSSTEAPYNVALCLQNLGYRGDAAKWYEEVLRRDPQYTDRVEIQKQINLLRSAVR